MALTRETVNINPYEKAYDELKTDKNFSGISWETAKRRNQLNQYVGALYTAKEKGISIEPSTYGYDYDMSRLTNELYSDKEELKPREFTKVTVDETGKESEELEVIEMSDYEYNTKLLDDYRNYKDDSQLQMLEIEQKEARQNFFTSVAATLGEFGVGIVENGEFLDLLMAPAEMLLSGKDYRQAVKEGMFGNISDSLRASLDEYQKTHTSFRDINGNYTTVGKMIGGTANSIGRMMPMILTNAIPGLNAYAGIAQAAYYGSMYQSQVRQMFNDSKFKNVNTFAIVANSLLKTAIEYGTEILSDRLTGGAGTTLDNIVFGRGTGATSGLSKSAVFMKSLKDAAIEGSEEVTAQIANYILDTAFSAFVDEKFKPNIDDISLEGIMDAYVMGALTSFVMTKGTALMTRRVEINGKKLTKSQSVAYNMNVSNLINNWNNIISNEKSKIASLDKLKDKLSPLQFDKLRNKAIVEARNNLSQASQGLQVLADIHKEMGDVRFASAMSMLQMNQQRLMTQPIETIKDFVKIDMDRYFKATPKGQLVDAVNKRVEELIESGVIASVEVGEVYDDNGVRQEFSQQDSVLYVDGGLLVEGDTNGVISKLVERQILSLLDKHLSKDIKNFVINSYNEFKGDIASVEEAMINLMYNVEFSTYLTSQVKDFDKFIRKLTTLFEEQVSFKNYKEGGKYATIFKVAIDKMVANLNKGNVQQKKEIANSNDMGDKAIKLDKAKRFKTDYDASQKTKLYQSADNMAVDYAKGDYIGTGRYLTPMNFKEGKAIEKLQSLFRQFFTKRKPNLDAAVSEMFQGKSDLFNQYMHDHGFTDPLIAMNNLLKDSKLDFAVISNKGKIQVVSLSDVGKVLKTVPKKGETFIQYLNRAKVKIRRDVRNINHLIDFEGMSTEEAIYRSRYVELSDLFDPAIVKVLQLNNKNRVYIDVNGSATVNLTKDADLSLPVNNYGISGYFINKLKTIVVSIDTDARVFTHEVAHMMAAYGGISMGINSTVTAELVKLVPKLREFFETNFPKIMELYKGDAGHALYEMTNGEQWANGEMFKDFTNLNTGFDIYVDGTMIIVKFVPTGETFQLSKFFSPAYMEYEKENTPTLERYENPETRRVIRKKDSSKNLELMRKDNGKLQLDKRVKAFWTDADLSKVSTELADMLKSGDLKYNAHNKMTKYFNTADKISQYEFNLFKEHFFKDSKFTTAKQLEDFVTQYMFEFHVLYRLINMYNETPQETYFFDDTGLKNMMKQLKSRHFSNEASAVLSALDVTETMSFDQLVKAVNILKADPSLKRDFDNSQMMLQKSKRGYVQTGFTEDSTIMRSAAMRRYKNNLLSANKLYGTFYTANVKTKGVQTSQLSTENKDGNTKDFQLEDTTENITFEFVQEQIQNYIADVAYKNVDNGKITEEQAEAFISKKYKQLNEFSTGQLFAFWETLLEKGLINPYANEQVVTDSDTRLTTSVRSSVIKLMNKIDQNGITKAKFEKLSKSEQAMFERNKRNKYVVKPEYYYMFTEADAEKKSSYNSMVRSNEAEVQREVEAIKQDYRDKLKKTEAALISIYDKIKKPIKQVIVEVENKQRVSKLERELKSLQEKMITPKEVVVTESTFNINSSTTIPPKFKKLFETEFSKTHKSKTKHVGEGVVTERINIREFRDANSDLLNSFTKKEIIEVIEFFESGMLFSGTISLTDLNRLEAFRILTLAHFAQNTHLFGDDPSIKERINKIAQQTASSDARGLSLWRDVFNAYDPKKAIQDFFASTFSLKLDDSELEDIEKAITSGDTDAIAKETIKLTQLVSDKRSVKNVRNYIGKLTSFRYMSMLSSPATSARNFVSNHTMTGVNTLSEKISKWLFRKNRMRKGQVDLSVKPSENTKKFLNEKFAFKRKHGVVGPVTVKGEFVDLLSGANRFRFETGKTSAQNIQQMIVNKVMSDIYGDSSFKSTALKKAQWLVGMMLSDDMFIRKATAKYMAALIENAKVDVTKYEEDFKVKSQVTQFLVDAAALAYHDYMRSDNIFSQIEMLIKNKSESGYFVYKLLFPFAKSSWNFTKELFRMSPFGLAKAIIDLVTLDGKIAKANQDYKFDKEGDRGTLPPQFTEYLVKRNLGKGIIGSFLFVVGSIIAAFTDLIDFDEDDMAIVIANTSFDISNITGTGGLLAGAAFVKSIQGQGSTINIINSLTDQFTEELFFMSVLNNWRYSSGNLSDFTTRQLNTFMSSFIPNVLKQFNNALYNHNVKYNTGPIGFMERFATSLIPGLAYALPRQVNIYTGEEQLQYDVPFILDAINMFSPIKISSYTPSDLEYLSIGLNINKKPLTGKYTVNGKEFKGDVNKANQFYGNANKTQLTALVNNKFKAKVQMPDGSFRELYWSQMTDIQRKNSFTTVMENNASYAKVYSWTEAGHKYYASETEYYKLLKSGVTKNLYRGTKGFVD